MPKRLTPPLKWHGGKQYLAKQIIELMPPRCTNPNAPHAMDPGWLHYVEPYFGGGAVLLENDPEGISEVVNDLNGELVNFWRMIQNSSLFPSCFQGWSVTPFSKKEFDRAGEILAKPVKFENATERVEHAYAFFIRCRQSLSGRMDSFASITRNRTRRGMNEQVSAWLNGVDGLPEVHARMMRVLILNKDALEVIRSEDGPRTLFYLDPPYLSQTRTAPSVYMHETSYIDHQQLLGELGKIKGRFLLSGYDSPLYQQAMDAYGWKRHEFELPNNAAGGKSKRRMTECVWCNY